MLILFLLLLIPVQIIGGSILLRGTQVVRQNTIEKSQRALNGAAEHLSAQIDTIYQRVYAYLQNSGSNLRQPFNSLVQGKPSRQWINLRDIMKELSWIRFSNDAILDIRVYYPTLGFSVGNTEYRALTETGALFEYSANSLIFAEDQLMLTLTYPSMPSSSSDAIILLRVWLSAEQLRSMAEEKVFAGNCLILFDGQCVAGTEEAMSYFAGHAVKNDTKIPMESGTYQAFSASDTRYGLTLINLVPSSILDATSYALNTLFVVYAILSIVLLAAYAFIMRRIVYYPLRNLLNGYKAIQAGSLDARVEAKGPSELLQLIEGFNQMAAHLSDAMQTLYEQKVYAQQIEFKQLQAQINPHFLYNTFFMLERMVDDEDSNAARATCRYLGEYFQYITYPSAQMALIKDEYAHAMNYLMLQKQRHEERLTLDLAEIPSRIGSMEVPRLIFQPILENMFAHGIQHTDGAMTVRTRVFQDNALRILFENSALEPPSAALSLNLDLASPEGKTTGLMNIHRRIRLKFGVPYGLQLTQSDLGGLRVTVLLPCPTEEETEHAIIHRVGR